MSFTSKQLVNTGDYWCHGASHREAVKIFSELPALFAIGTSTGCVKWIRAGDIYRCESGEKSHMPVLCNSRLCGCWLTAEASEVYMVPG